MPEYKDGDISTERDGVELTQGQLQEFIAATYELDSGQLFSIMLALARQVVRRDNKRTNSAEIYGMITKKFVEACDKFQKQQRGQG